ncbi:MAG TPA: hypothetical protein VM120_28340 [Bryobacteraceae bacterium]|nr:hypothetical protein [Bryobacteraceae bacterium]
MYSAVSVFGTAIMGALIGAVGRSIMPAKDTGGVITTATLGICGASLTNSIGWLMGWWTVGSVVGLAASAAAAVVALIIYRFFASQSW